MPMSGARSYIYVVFHFLQYSISLSICCVVVYSPLVHNGSGIGAEKPDVLPRQHN